jgi:hypothetical protein
VRVVAPEVLQRRIEDLLDRAVEAVDLVDEEHVPLRERGQDRGDVALAFERRAGRRAEGDAELLADDVSEAGLAEAGRPDQQNVIERLPTRAGRLERDCELLLDALLSNELVQPARPQRALELVLLGLYGGSEELRLRHAASRSARRTWSSTGRAGSTCASARSASTGV